MNSRSDLREFDGRIVLLMFLFLIPFLGLVARLWFLQVEQGDAYYRIAGQNFVRSIEIAPDRGGIFDARGRTVAENRPAYDVLVTPGIMARHPEAADRLATILNLSRTESERLRRRLADGARSDILVRRDVPRDDVAELEMARQELPGAWVRVSQRRYYPWDSLAAHLVGFMNEIGVEELERLQEHGYRRSDYIGRTGLERAFEAILRGAPGLERQVIDVQGDVQTDALADQLLGHYRRVDPVAGRNLHLTIDMQLQEIVEEAARTAVSGGIVALDPRDGSILATYSKPGFNPNAWSGRLSEAEKRASDNNPFHPMLDKSVQSWFPGSTYKVITAIAALEEGLIRPEDTIECPGFLYYGNRVFRCWNRGGHGKVNLTQAMAASCDVYFYQLGLQLGIDRMATYATEFGFGERPGLAFNGESAGVVPTREWHETHSPGGFQYGFTVNTSVGQGDTRVSPLQLALAYAALINGGSLHYPRIVDRVTSMDGQVLFEYPRRLRRTLRFEDRHVADVLHGLRAVLHEDFGTAKDYRLGYVEAGGKTGTAQVRALDTVRLENGEIYFRDRDHAWFVAFAPIEDPRIVVSVFLEHGGKGSSAAAPVAMAIVDRYFREVLGWDEVIGPGRGATRPSAAAPWRSVVAGAIPTQVEGVPVAPRTARWWSGAEPVGEVTP